MLKLGTAAKGLKSKNWDNKIEIIKYKLFEYPLKY